ncbi:uncharacterized protein Z518_06527 [Rhinocladiella mackenziei CBS 650.93]|uniref:HMA domain-containing protein n=1 Tax=Rhinocladiella mackenziei CBS 650.93 TaxID=1442369 RepID=A0A0D2FLW8_9EURO|nr:uncharacterized protein Z518_06527 [Rhinocladiella mackenziei CBS 650.93]KIX02977.1 hypothetical protein Z518_06527 [Rhinocladiella mackenziei CBS 650.93]
MIYTSTILVSNIHCPSCVSYAQDVLREVPAIFSVDVSLIDHTIRVKHEQDQTQEIIVKELIKAAFEVQHVTTVGPGGVQSHDYDVSHGSTTASVSRSTWLMSRAQRKHIANCKACQQKRDRTPTRRGSWAALSRACRPSLFRNKSTDNRTRISDDTLVEQEPADVHTEPREYIAHISIGGMTCASCSGTIAKELANLDFVKSIDVRLMTNNARVVFQAPPQNSGRIVEAIEDLGYEATIDDVLPSTPEKRISTTARREYKVSLHIDGMTCGSCVGTITRGLQELPFVRSVNIDLVRNSGVAVFSDRQNLESILEKIDDLGYDSAVVKVDALDDTIPAEEQERAVQIQIDGMYCEHCPDNIKFALETTLSPSRGDGKPNHTITQWPTLDDPLITIVYRPSPPDLTVRTFISVIDATHEAFHASVYQPPTLEERSRRMQRREQQHILWRLLFTAVVAIPTFIIGVVYMSLVPESNRTRQWLQGPIMAGKATRMEWALFFMTTPVMFFGTDIFHRRAFKEIKSMWRPTSKVPILRRFYRFGSMNLLISAGTSVAYFSSLAILIMDATDQSQSEGEHRSSAAYFDTVTFLTFFILIGRFLEAYSKAKTGDAVAMLSKLRPSDAFLVENRDTNTHGTQPSIRKIPVDQLEVGDIVQIPHGTSPPTDGTVDQQGTFLFDESSLTGESKPVQKTYGEEVYTGSVNVSDPVRVRVTATSGTSMLDQIVHVVREGQAKRAPIERIADSLTGYFVPVITLLAILTWLIWLGLGQSGALPQAWLDVSQGGWPFWSLEFAIAVFVVACPCGIGLAAPTALFVGGGLAAQQGILVQGGGEAFQEASQIDAIVFDKTGTLTEGQMRVTDFEMLHPADDRTVAEGIILAASRIMEQSSTHPMAKAIVDYCAQKADEAPVEHQEVKEVPGQGMTVKFTVKTSPTTTQYEAALGNERLVRSLPHSEGAESISGMALSSSQSKNEVATNEDFYLDPVLRKHQSLGHSTAIFAIRETPPESEEISPIQALFRPVALFAIADPIRVEAPSILQSLRESNLEVHMCTGDNQTTAMAIASQLGIPVSNVRAGVLPQDKAAYICELQRLPSNHNSSPNDKHSHRQIIAFVGDGTNDTPALSAADVSIALSSGSDVAVTTASFILLNSDLTTILSLVRLAKRVFLRVKLNFAWAAVYNLCLVPVAAGVFFPIGANEDHGGWRLGPVWASVAMAASSVSVVMSSLALKLPAIRWTKNLY